MNIEIAAKNLGVDPNALESLLMFIMDNIEENPEVRKFFLMNPDAFLKVAVQKWYESSVKAFEKLKDPTSPEFKQLASDVWETLQKTP